MAKITYDNKVALNPQPSVANVNKVSDADMNEIKTSVNDLYDATDNYSKDTYTSNGITLRFEKIGRVVVCTFEGTTTSSLTADTNYSVQIDAKYTPKEVVRNCVVFNEPGVIGYIYIPVGTTLQYRVKTNVGTNQYPRFSFTYITQD